MIRASSAWATVRTTKSYESRHCLAPESTGQATLQTHEIRANALCQRSVPSGSGTASDGWIAPIAEARNAQVAGTCQAWTGAYPDGQQWVTFMRHKAAVLISTNTLTGTQLLTYVGSLCPTVSH
jgi:hypothetical protein